MTEYTVAVVGTGPHPDASDRDGWLSRANSPDGDRREGESGG